MLWYEQEKKQADVEAEEHASKKLTLEAAQAEMARDLSNEVRTCITLFLVVALFQAIYYSSSRLMSLFAGIFSYTRSICSWRDSENQ